jgi:hypothetical protein
VRGGSGTFLRTLFVRHALLEAALGLGSLPPFRLGRATKIHQLCSGTEEVVLGPAPTSIIMVTLWVLFVKCKLRESLKK